MDLEKVSHSLLWMLRRPPKILIFILAKMPKNITFFEILKMFLFSFVLKSIFLNVTTK